MHKEGNTKRRFNPRAEPAISSQAFTPETSPEELLFHYLLTRHAVSTFSSYCPDMNFNLV